MQGNTPEDYKNAVDHMLTSLCLTTEDFPNAISAVHALIKWNVEIALDPKVNGGKVMWPEEKIEELLDRDFKLRCLENGGVDNWDWYGESLEEYWESKEEE